MDNPNLIKLAKLDGGEVDALRLCVVTNNEDSATLTPVDFNEILPDAVMVKRRHLANIGKYLRGRQTIDSKNMFDVLDWLDNRSPASATLQQTSTAATSNVNVHDMTQLTVVHGMTQHSMQGQQQHSVASVLP